jgi:hypothetical protein
MNAKKATAQPCCRCQCHKRKVRQPKGNNERLAALRAATAERPRSLGSDKKEPVGREEL